MKKFMFIILMIFSAIGKLFSNVPDSVPNPGFETWFTTTWFDFPAEWMTSNNQLLPSTVVKDSAAHSGALAMKLAYEGSIIPHAWCDFGLANHPTNLLGYIKNELNPNDSITIVVRVYLSQQLVDSGFEVIYGGINPNWTLFYVPISQSAGAADSCEISIMGSNMFSSSASFDDLFLDFSTIVCDCWTSPRINIYPVPANDYIVIENNSTANLNCKIYDAIGNICVAAENGIVLTGNERRVLNIENYAKGVYTILTKSESSTKAIQFIKIE
jgi:hypothetical protein